MSSSVESLKAAGSHTARPSRRLDAVLVVLCMVVGAIVGARYYATVWQSGGKPWFYQVSFGPAVMWTCGKGFVVPDETKIPALADFLQSRTDRFSCADLPPVTPVPGVSGAQPWLAWSHLLRSAAIVWTVRGISWSGLWPVAGVFFGATVALAFLVFRLVAGRVLAGAGALFVLTSPFYLLELPQFRDYSKVPFMLALTWVMAQLLSPTLTRRGLLAVAAAYGAILGLGIGFRDDPLITIPVFLCLLLLARPVDQPARRGWKASALAVFVAIFLVVASPVMRVYMNGGGAFMSHAALLGMMSPLGPTLGVTTDSLYEVGYGLDDSYAAALVSGYATREAGRPQPIAGHSREYDAASSHLLVATVLALPADNLARAYASIARIIELPSSLVETEPPPYISSSLLRRFFARRSQVAGGLYWLWPLALASAFVIVSARSVRLAVVVGVLFVYFTAYPAVQFNARHILYLSLIPIAALLFTAQTLLSRNWGGSPRHVVIFFASAAILLLVPLVAARAYQQRHLLDLFHSYLSAPLVHLDAVQRPLPDGHVELALAPLDGDGRARATPESVATDFLIAEFAGGACDALQVSVTARYDGSPQFSDFTHRFSVTPPSQPGTTARVMFATFAYYGSPSDTDSQLWYRFRGLELPREQLACLTGVSRLGTPAQFPILLNATLPPDWERQPLYQSFAGWESRPRAADAKLYTDPADLHVARRMASAGVDQLRDSDVDERARQVSFPANGDLAVDGAGGIGGPGPFTYLVRFKTRNVVRGQRLIAEGILDRGGLAIGLLKDGQWAAQVTILEPGPFVGVIAAPDAGNYALIIANNLMGPSLGNHFTLKRVGWASAPGPS